MSPPKSSAKLWFDPFVLEVEVVAQGNQDAHREHSGHDIDAIYVDKIGGGRFFRLRRQLRGRAPLSDSEGRVAGRLGSTTGRPP